MDKLIETKRMCADAMQCSDERKEVGGWEDVGETRKRSQLEPHPSSSFDWQMAGGSFSKNFTFCCGGVVHTLKPSDHRKQSLEQ
jgi:hypothetical protein